MKARPPASALLKYGKRVEFSPVDETRVCDECGRTAPHDQAVVEGWRYYREHAEGNRKRLLCNECLSRAQDSRPRWYDRRGIWLATGLVATAMVGLMFGLATWRLLNPPPDPNAPAIGIASTEALARSFERVQHGATDGECNKVRAGVYSCTAVWDPGSGYEGPFDVRRTGNCWQLREPIPKPNMQTRGCITRGDQ